MVVRGAVEPAEETVGQPVAGSSECIDPVGDATPAGSDLTRVAVTTDGSTVRVVWELAGTPGFADHGQSWIVEVSEGFFRHLALKTVDTAGGRDMWRFTYDADRDPPQNNLTAGRGEAGPSSYTLEVNRVTAVFPVSAMPSLADGFSWSALTSFEGTDPDQCPAEGNLSIP